MSLIPIIYPILAGLAMGLYVVSHKMAAEHIHHLIGAIGVSAFAVMIGSIVFLMNYQAEKGDITWNWKGTFFIMCAGLCALSIDYFSLKTYFSDLDISIAGLITLGIGTMIPVIAGIFFFKESADFIKIIGIAFVITGCAILAAR